MSIKKYTSYMEKKALGVDITEGLKQLAEKTPYLLVIPALVGGTAGYVASKVTSPTNTDTEKLQNDFLREKLRTHVATRQREVDIARNNAKNKNLADKGPREIMI